MSTVAVAHANRWPDTATSERQPLLPSDESEGVVANPSQHQQHLPCDSSDQIAHDASYTHTHYSFKLMATMLNFLTSGIALTAVGALLPEIECYYRIKDATVAFIFPATVAGYILSTLTTQTIHVTFGRRGIAWFSSLLRLFCSIILSAGPPFSIGLMTYFVFGYSAGLTDSGWCAWAANLPYVNIAQGLLHGSFAVGCILGPLTIIAVFKKGFEWYAFYHIIGILAILEWTAQAWAFRLDDAETYRQSDDRHYGGQKLHPLKNRLIWICGLYYLVYIGIEASFSDWIVVYMQRTQQLESNASRLASSIFWSGMCIGRFALGPVTERYGLRSSVFVYMTLCVCLQVLFRLVGRPTISLSALGLIGFFCGPMFPSGLLLLTGSLPQHTHVRAVAIAAAVGQIGGATVPLGIGFMAEKLGIRHLLDAVLVLSVMMILVWIVFAKSTLRMTA